MKPTPLDAAKAALALLKQNCPENLCLYVGYYDAIRALEDTIRTEDHNQWVPVKCAICGHKDGINPEYYVASGGKFFCDRCDTRRQYEPDVKT